MRKVFLRLDRDRDGLLNAHEWAGFVALANSLSASVESVAEALLSRPVGAMQTRPAPVLLEWNERWAAAVRPGSRGTDFLGFCEAFG